MGRHGSLMVSALVLVGCATEEEVLFGEPGRVTGGFDTTSVTAGGGCQVNGACTVSWRQQIYGQILDGDPAGPAPTGACGARDCHDEGAGNLVFPSGDPEVAYDNLLAYELPGGLPYVVPCEPSLSYIMCNLRFESGVDNPYVGPDASFTGGCGSSMPKDDPPVGASPLTQDQLDLLAEWILCGAPNN